MRKVRLLLLLVAALALGACAITRPSMSYVAPEVTASDAQTLAHDAVAFLVDPLPPAKTTLLLDLPSIQNGGRDVLTSAMVESLRQKGYGLSFVVDGRAASQDTHATAFRYLASPLDSGIVLRLQFEGQEATKLYPRTTDGTLLTNGPFLLREVGR